MHKNFSDKEDYARPGMAVVFFLPEAPMLDASEDDDDEGDVGGNNPDPGGWN